MVFEGVWDYLQMHWSPHLSVSNPNVLVVCLFNILLCDMSASPQVS